MAARRGGMVGVDACCHTAGCAGFAADQGVVPMNVVFEELTSCVGDGCVNRFADDGGCEGYCPECLALWDDHAAGQHDSPVDACRLCR